MRLPLLVSPAEPTTLPPPWMNTITGSDAPAGTLAGRQTLSVRQSSWPCTGAIGSKGVVCDWGICGHDGAHSVAARGSVQHAVTGAGGRQRSAPVGGSAKGIPSHRSDAPSAVPRTSPRSVRAMSGSADAAGAQAPGAFPSFPSATSAEASPAGAASRVTVEEEHAEASARRRMTPTASSIERGRMRGRVTREPRGRHRPRRSLGLRCGILSRGHDERPHRHGRPRTPRALRRR